MENNIIVFTVALPLTLSLLAPIKQEADYSPLMIFTLGNHEERLKRVAKDSPEMSGFIDL